MPIPDPPTLEQQHDSPVPRTLYPEYFVPIRSSLSSLALSRKQEMRFAYCFRTDDCGGVDHAYVPKLAFVKATAGSNAFWCFMICKIMSSLRLLALL